MHRTTALLPALQPDCVGVAALMRGLHRYVKIIAGIAASHWPALFRSGYCFTHVGFCAAAALLPGR